MRKIYDCQTLEELIDFIAIHKRIPREFIRIDEDLKIHILSVECTQWTLEKTRRRVYGETHSYDWYILRQRREDGKA